MKRVYSGSGPATAIVWTLHSDARFVYHGWNMVAELEMQPTATDAPRRTLVQAAMPYLRRSYLWGPDTSGTLDGAGGVGGLLAMRRHERSTQSTETFWATHDLNGNIIGLVQLPVTGSQPAKMAVYDYDASGQVTQVNEPEANFNPIRFSSKYTDSETGLVYYGYRYLSTELGRWISRDPIGEEGGVNLYGMVGNDAVNRWDLLGHWEGSGGGPDGPPIFTDRATVKVKERSERWFADNHGAWHIVIEAGDGMEMGCQDFYAEFLARPSITQVCPGYFSLDRYVSKSGVWDYDYNDEAEAAAECGYWIGRKGRQTLIPIPARTPVDTPHGGWGGFIPLTAHFKLVLRCGNFAKKGRKVSSLNIKIRVIGGLSKFAD